MFNLTKNARPIRPGSIVRCSGNGALLNKVVIVTPTHAVVQSYGYIVAGVFTPAKRVRQRTLTRTGGAALVSSSGQYYWQHVTPANHLNLP